MRKIRWLLVAKDRDPALAALLHTKNIDAQLERDNHDGLLLGAHWEDDADCRGVTALVVGARGLKEHGFQIYRPFFLKLFGTKWGFEFSRVGVGPTPYLDRYILYVGVGTLRLHKFWRGDDDRAPHDHPWWFITFPFTTYLEKVPVDQRAPGGFFSYIPAYSRRMVKAWRFHFRPAKYQHIVEGAADQAPERFYYTTGKPFWTLVITGGKSNEWGFWPLEYGRPRFVGYKNWSRYLEENQ